MARKFTSKTPTGRSILLRLEAQAAGKTLAPIPGDEPKPWRGGHSPAPRKDFAARPDGYSTTVAPRAGERKGHYSQDDGLDPVDIAVGLAVLGAFDSDPFTGGGGSSGGGGASGEW